MSDTARPEVNGQLFRGYVASVEQRGFLPALREKVEPATRELIDKPPFILRWVANSIIEDLFQTIEALRGAIGRSSRKLGPTGFDNSTFCRLAPGSAASTRVAEPHARRATQRRAWW